MELDLISSYYIRMARPPGVEQSFVSLFWSQSLGRGYIWSALFFFLFPLWDGIIKLACPALASQHRCSYRSSAFFLFPAFITSFLGGMGSPVTLCPLYRKAVGAPSNGLLTRSRWRVCSWSVKGLCWFVARGSIDAHISGNLPFMWILCVCRHLHLFASRFPLRKTKPRQMGYCHMLRSVQRAHKWRKNWLVNWRVSPTVKRVGIE